VILEHALLDVAAGREEQFEEAFSRAKAIIAQAHGVGAVRLERCVEQPHRYLLLVEWETLEDHIDGFRGSAAYDEWRALLHHFYDPFPSVTHFTTVARA